MWLFIQLVELALILAGIGAAVLALYGLWRGGWPVMFTAILAVAMLFKWLSH